MNPLAQHIAERLESKFMMTKWVGGRAASSPEILAAIESAIAEHQQATEKEEAAVDALIAMALHPRSEEITAKVNALLDAPLCQHCGKPESEHVGYWQFCPAKNYATLFTLSVPTEITPAVDFFNAQCAPGKATSETLKIAQAAESQYRMLEAGELLKEGDEIYDGDLCSWRKARSCFGWRMTDIVVGQYRRKLTPADREEKA